MPQDDQINYNVKVRLDPNTQTTDASVIYDVSEDKFALGTAASSDIVINEGDTRITTSNGTTTKVLAQTYFRYVGGTSAGTDFGKVAIGDALTATPFRALDVGRNVTTTTTNFDLMPQALFYSTNATEINKNGIKIGLERVQVGLATGTQNLLAGVVGTAATGNNTVNTTFILGSYRAFNNGEIIRHLSMNENGAIGIGFQDDLTATQVYDTPKLQTWNNQQGYFQVGHDGGGSASPTTGQFTQYDQSQGTNNVTLQLRLNADEGTQTGTSIFKGFNPKFIRFQRRNNNGSSSDWATCGSVVLTNTGTTAFVTTSDKRLKKDFQPFPLGLNELLKINPLKYTWIDSNQIDLGFIAQELYEIYPHAVSVPKDKEDFLNDPWSIDYAKLTPLLVKSIQDQQKIIEKLNNRITHLEKAIN